VCSTATRVLLQMSLASAWRRRGDLAHQPDLVRHDVAQRLHLAHHRVAAIDVERQARLARGELREDAFGALADGGEIGIELADQDRVADAADEHRAVADDRRALELHAVLVGRHEHPAADARAAVVERLVVRAGEVKRAARPRQDVGPALLVERMGGDRQGRAALGRVHRLEVEAVLADRRLDDAALGLGAGGAAFDDLAHVPVGARLDAARDHAERGVRRRIVGAAADDDVDVGPLGQHLGEGLGADLRHDLDRLVDRRRARSPDGPHSVTRPSRSRAWIIARSTLE
jgi:hypothetical protein